MRFIASFVIAGALTAPVFAQELKPIQAQDVKIAQPPKTGISIGYDTLFWNTSRDGLDYVADRGASPPTLIGNLHTVGLDGDTGDRLTIGLDLPGSWELGLAFTNFEAAGSDSVTIVSNNMFGTRHHPTNVADRGNGNVGFARGQFDIDYQAIDFTIGSKTPMRFLGGEVTRFYGVRSLDVSQRLQTRYANNTQTDITDITDEAKIDGLGLFIGANTRYRVNPNFAIRARALGGPAIVSADVTYREVETDNSVTNVDVTLSEDDVALFFEIAIGGEYLVYRYRS